MSCCGDNNPVSQVTPPAAQSEPLTMSKEAADYVKMLLNKEPEKKNWGLKIDVVPGGCAGFKYFMEFKEKSDADEKVFEFHGVKVFLSLMSLGFIKGGNIAYASSLEGSGIKIENPNMTRTCGCGKSFG